MDERRREKLSRLLTYLLRHNPSAIGMTLDERGFSDITVDELARRISERGGYEWVKPEHILTVVKTDEKGRFEIADGKIRATYGHSIDVSTGVPVKDVKVLYHGITLRAWKRIKDEGIKPRKRRFVHLSSSVEDAVNVARRHGRDVIVLEINAEEMIKDGYEIRKAGKGIYLVREVPPKYITGAYV